MKRIFVLGTLESRIYTFFTLLVFASVFIVQLVSFRFTIQSVQQSTLTNSNALLNQLVSQIDSYISGMNHISQTIAGDTQIRRYLETGDDPDTAEEIKLRFRSYIEARTDVSNILIAGLDGTLISGDPEFLLNTFSDLKESAWYRNALESGNNAAVSNAYVQNLFLGRYTWVVSISRTIPGEVSKMPVGVLLVDLRFNQIKELCESMVVGGNGYNFILDAAGNYVFHPTQQLVYSDIHKEPLEEIMASWGDETGAAFDDGQRHYTVAESTVTGWRIVNVMYSSRIVIDWRSVQLSYTFLGLILFLVVGIITNRLSSSITQPLRRLQDIIKSVDTGDFKMVGRIKGTDEIRELAREYDIMVGRIRELMEANTKEQELKRKSDLKALQAQINPHFLYNTLDSIIWMGEMNQNAEVVKMTSALSKLFRISISRGRELIPISDEIAHIESYLTIQGMRYRDKFSYTIDIDQALHELVTLKITLQPLVENAIYHGIKEVEHRGQIEITGRLDNNVVTLMVKDNGRGMSPEELNTLNRSLASTAELLPETNRHGMGVRNVHERIRLYFGESYGLLCESLAGIGTTMTVRIPAMQRDSGI